MTTFPRTSTSFYFWGTCPILLGLSTAFMCIYKQLMRESWSSSTERGGILILTSSSQTVVKWPGSEGELQADQPDGMILVPNHSYHGWWPILLYQTHLSKLSSTLPFAKQNVSLSIWMAFYTSVLPQLFASGTARSLQHNTCLYCPTQHHYLSLWKT